MFEPAAAGPVKPCASIPCKNGGTCTEQGQGYQCQCAEGFTGDQGNNLVDNYLSANNYLWFSLAMQARMQALAQGLKYLHLQLPESFFGFLCLYLHP